MKIKKHGKKYEDKPKLEEFECEKCGCEFNAEDDEFYVDKNGAEPDNVTNLVSTSLVISSKITVRDYLVCSCPECHKIIKKIRIREKNNYDYPFSVTSYTSATSATKAIDVNSLDVDLSGCTTVHNNEPVTLTAE